MRPHEARALVAEVHLALVQHHAALAGEDGLAAHREVDAHELLVLRGPAAARGGFLVGLERGGESGGRGRGLRRVTPGLLARELTGRLAGDLAVARLLPVGGRGGRRDLARVLARDLSGDLTVRGLRRLRRLAVRRRGRRGDRRGHGGRGVHRGRGDGLLVLRLRGAGCGHGRAEGGRGGRGLLGRGAEGRGRGGRLRRRCEPGRGGGGGLRLRLLGDLAAEVPQQCVEPAVEALADGGEAPHVLQVEVAEHHGPLGGELRTGEGVPDDLFAMRPRSGCSPVRSATSVRHRRWWR